MRLSSVYATSLSDRNFKSCGGLKQHGYFLSTAYRPSTSFSFSLKMFFSSPRVDSIFSRENWFSPSADLSLATQLLSSTTVLSRRVHSLTRVSTFFTQVSEVPLTLSNLAFRAATSASDSV